MAKQIALECQLRVNLVQEQMTRNGVPQGRWTDGEILERIRLIENRKALEILANASPEEIRTANEELEADGLPHLNWVD